MEEQTVRESEYVLAVLCWMRDKVSANPKLFDPDAQCHDRRKGLHGWNSGRRIAVKP
jgi:hypothetical protein